MAGGKVRRLVVAIDGPAGAGKSTLAKRLAKELGYTYMDTGAMYRAIAFKLMREGIDPGDEPALGRILAETRIELLDAGGALRVLLDGDDVTERIRAPQVSQVASKVSAVKIVRERLLELQRSMGARGGIVAEGRDIGTVVFPGADVKIYLDASLEERARRRFEELRSLGREVSLAETLAEMRERDRRDQRRALAPLRKAEGALVIDSSGLSPEAVAERVMREIQARETAIQ